MYIEDVAGDNLSCKLRPSYFFFMEVKNRSNQPKDVAQNNIGVNVSTLT